MGPYSGRASFPGGPSAPRPKPERSNGDGRRRGRPPRAPSPSPRQIYNKLNPKFIAYLCEWAGCTAQLHNFETLRKHVLVVHGSSGTCKWAKCSTANPPQIFSSKESFEAHVDKAHLIPLVWHVGDGPQNDAKLLATTPSMSGDADPLPAYLFGEDGTQVTPSVKDQMMENEDERKERRKQLHRLLLERDRNAPEEVELTDEELVTMTPATDF